MSIGSSGGTAVNSASLVAAPLDLAGLAFCGRRSLPPLCLRCSSTAWYQVRLQAKGFPTECSKTLVCPPALRKLRTYDVVFSNDT